uniref:Uncharacterized protein n=1 Tax=Tanacetum cinerariifolium TaxID=118510 RepID=A0A6L2KYN9_TANCI|nr:hypothetical protein [Tanacetum cinerariifolium]
MANDEENHALVTDEEAPTEFALMANTSAKSKTGLPEFADDTVTDYSRPSPTMERTSGDDQNRNPSVFETDASPSTITPKPFIKFVKPNDSPSKSKTGKTKTPKKPPVKYAKQYKKPNKKPNVRGNQRNWNNLKSHQLGPNFVMKKKACFNCGDFNYLAYDYRKRVKRGISRSQNDIYESFTPRHGSSQNNINDKGYWDSGCSRHMTDNISYLSDYEPFDGGYVSFGQRGCKITVKGIIKTGKLEFENVYFVKDLKYNLFSMLHICDNKNSVLFTDSKCIVLGRDFKLLDDVNILLRTPRQHNMYSINLNNIVPHKDLTCLVAKASADECMLWHRRLGHLNFNTMNKLVRHNLVRGLPTKCFENDHTCTACLKGKQHKASYKSKLVNSVSKPLHTLHMDLFGLTSVSSIIHKWYCLVVTDDCSRCDNGGEFRNKEMNDFCSQKEIKREFSNAKTPQQNGVAERVLVNKSQNKTAYELFNGRTPAIGFLKPFGCHVMILNTLDNLGKLKAKGDKGIKDAENQEVKKNVYSLRYIALPNWVHDALLESSSSKPQDDCSTDVPNSSGNPNPTASTTYPPADQLETLTVESPIPTVLKNKKDERGIVIRNKARLVAQGHIQEEGINYDEVFAHVARIEAIKLFLAYASFMGFTVYQIDVKSAFLYGTIDEEVYVMQPPGFQDPEFPARVYKLEKAMYGLHQALRAWYGTLSKYLLTNGFQRGIIDQTLFIRRRLISWQCKKQTIVATSTTEAEYVAAASCRGQVLWIHNQLLDYGDCFEKKLISVDHIYTDETVADLLTKPFDAGRFQYLVLEKSEHNVDFHHIVDFVEASPLSPTFSGRIVPLFDTMLVPQGKGSGTPIKPHHTPSLEGLPTSHATYTSTTLPPIPTASIPTVTPSETTPIRKYTRRARIAQSFALPPVVDEPASPLRDVSQGEACATDSGFIADQDRVNIAKSSTLPHDPAPRVTSPAAVEGKINRLKARVKLFEDREGVAAERSRDDAPIKGRNLDEGEVAAERVSDDSKEMATVLTSMDAAAVLAGGVAEVPTGSGSILTASPPATGVATGSDVVPTTSLIFATATESTQYTRRKGKETMVESETLKKQKVQEQIDTQVARELEEQMAREDQRKSEQIARDAEIARIHAEAEL